MILGLISAAAGIFALSSAPQASIWTPEERAGIVQFWHAPGRYTVQPWSKASAEGLFQTALSPDGSAWFLQYQKALGAAGAPPTIDVSAAEGPFARWEKWVQAKLAHDRASAQRLCDAANGRPSTIEIPPDPGPIPSDLLAATSNPPAFAAAVARFDHTIRFEDGETITYTDNLTFSHRPRYAYFRFPQGTVAYGPQLKDMPEEDLRSLFAAAGFSQREQRIARAVSILEGGFETVNTYDTGYVSVGFIQFVTLDNGEHSLTEVLLDMKQRTPGDFEQDFRRFGIDVSAPKNLWVLDPDTGAELTGKQAVMKLVGDKRLTAVFQRAGRRTAFRVAQIRTAKAHYWPEDDMVEIPIEGGVLKARVGDIVRSEAGVATLFDRKVNRGHIRPFTEVCAKLAQLHHLTLLDHFQAYEPEIVAALKYRKDFLADPGLSQP